LVVLVVEELVDIEVVKDAVVVVSHMIVVKIEGVGNREDPVLKEVEICSSGVRSVEVASKIVLIRVMKARSCETIKVVAEAVQGRCSSD